MLVTTMGGPSGDHLKILHSPPGSPFGGGAKYSGPVSMGCVANVGSGPVLAFFMVPRPGGPSARVP